MTQLRPLLTVDDIARHLHASHSNVLEWLAELRLPYFALGKGDAAMFRPEDVNRAIEETFAGAWGPVDALEQQPPEPAQQEPTEAIEEEGDGMDGLMEEAMKEAAIETLTLVLGQHHAMASDMLETMTAEGWTTAEIAGLDPEATTFDNVATPRARAKLLGAIGDDE